MVSIFSTRIWVARRSSRANRTVVKPHEMPAYNATTTNPMITIATNNSTKVNAAAQPERDWNECLIFTELKIVCVFHRHELEFSESVNLHEERSVKVPTAADLGKDCDTSRWSGAAHGIGFTPTPQKATFALD